MDYGESAVALLYQLINYFMKAGLVVNVYPVSFKTGQFPVNTDDGSAAPPDVVDQF